MPLIVGLDPLQDALIKVGYNLVKPHSSTQELLTLLDEAESLLKTIGQDQQPSMLNALIPIKDGLVTDGLMNHPDSDVRVSVVLCLSEFVRITAPDAPYNDEQMKEVFRLTVEAFEKLADFSSRSFKKAEAVLDNVCKVRSSMVMLDLECYDLVLQMFRRFLGIIRFDHSKEVFSSMEMIMITTIDELETEDVFQDLVDVLLDSVKMKNPDVSPMAWSLAEKVLSRCGSRLQPLILKGLKSTATSIDMYSPVVKTICDSVQEAIVIHEVVNTEETEAAEPDPELGREVALKDDALEENLDSGNARMELRSKSRSNRPVRDGTVRINVNGNNSRLLKEDAETELGVSGKRGRKPNSLMNPEDYDISWLSGKRASVRTSSNTKLPQKGSGGGESSRGKKRPLPKETSPATTSRAVKRSRFKIEDSDHDLDSLSSPRLKKQIEVPREKESYQEESDEIPEEEERKIGTSSRKTRSQNGLERSQRTAQKKPIVEAKIVNSSVKRTSDGRIIRRKTASLNTLGQRKDTIKVPQSSKSKKMVSQVAEESGETLKSHSARKQTTIKEVEAGKKGFGRELVGKRVNIWWPLDETYYEGVVEAYSARLKTHLVVYLDGDSEELNLVDERWKLLEDEDHTSSSEEDMEIDLPESVPLIDIMQRQKLKKCKTVEPASSSAVRSSSGSKGKNSGKKGKKDSGKKGKKQAKRGKSGSKTAAVKNLKSLKEVSAKVKTTEEQEDDNDNERDDSEKQEQSEGKSEEESLKMTDTEAETKEEEKQSPNSEAASERTGSGSEEEPKWRETDEDKGKNSSSSEMEKEEDEDSDMEAEAEERVEVNGTNMSESEKEGDEDKEMEDVADERDVTDKTNSNLSEIETAKEEGKERDVEGEAEEREEVDGKMEKTNLSEIEKEEAEKKDMENEAGESGEMVDAKVANSTLSEMEKEEEVDGKVTSTNLSETEKDVENEAEEKEEEVQDIVKGTLSEIEKEAAEEKEMESEAEEKEKVDDKVASMNVSGIEKEGEEKKET